MHSTESSHASVILDGTPSPPIPEITAVLCDSSESRRSANYQPNCWDYSFVQSLGSEYTEEKYRKQAERMKDDVKHLINIETMDPKTKLELIDVVQRLGLKYYFDVEIKEALIRVSNDNTEAWWLHDLHATALRFRLLREHGHNVVQDVFDRYKDETGKFKMSLCKDVMGLLSLYEASFLGLEDENTMDEAMAFATEHLRQLQGQLTKRLAKKVEHALDLPLHWRVSRVEARWFIDTYEQEPNMNPTLLKLAKLDFNIVQAIHQKEVSNLAKWWVNLGLNKMTFARDRMVENYMWCLGMTFEPQFGYFRETAAKMVGFMTTIDDFYDIYGSMEELEIFTDFINRWDIHEIDQLPQNMGICLLALYNTCNEIGHWTLKQRRLNIIPYLSKAWIDLCKAYFKEAKWFHEGYKPTLKEYLDNATISITAPVMLMIAYFMTSKNITNEALEYINTIPDLIRYTSLIVRLNDDLATSSHEIARGDNLKAIECYMNETGATEEVAREHIRGLVLETWKKLNKYMVDHHQYPFLEPFPSVNLNAARASHFFYEHGDGYGIPDGRIKDLLLSLLVQPSPFNCKKLLPK